MAAAIPSDQYPIVGREREQTQLRACLTQGLAGYGSLVLVSGEAGIGKTTLVDDLIRAAGQRDCLVLAGGCYDLTTTPPYGLWGEVIRSYNPPEGGTSPPTWFANPEELERMGSQARLFDEARRFFAEVTAGQPLVIVLEDLHWSDDSSLQLLRALVRELIDRPLVLIATYRDDELQRHDSLYQLLPVLVRESRAERIELRRLGKFEVREYLNGRYGLFSDDLKRLTSYLYRRSDGNPFYLTELLRMLEVDGQLRRGERGWLVDNLGRAPVPALVRQVVDGRLMRLDTVTCGLLDVAAVLGHEVSFALWREVAGIPEDDLLTAVQHAIDAQLIELADVDGVSRFRHALIRDTIYASISLPTRRGWHRQTAELLIQQMRQEPNIIADHFLRAGDPRAAGWFVVAGDNARKLFAHQTAIARYSRALDHDQWLSAEQRVTALRGRAIAYEHVGAFDDARIDHEAALTLACHVSRRAEWGALIDLGLLWSSRDYARSGDYLHQALEKARELDDLSAVGRTLNRLGNWHGNAGDPQRGAQLHLEALEIFQHLDDRSMLAETFDLLGMAMLFRGDHFLVAKYQQQAVAHFRESSDPQSLARSLLVLANLRPDFVSGTTVPAVTVGDSHRYGAESIELARQSGSRSIESWALSNHGWAALAAEGEYGSALDHARAGLALAEEIRHEQWTVYALLALGTLYIDLLASSQAREHVERALILSKQVNTRFFIETATALLARLALTQGDLHVAESLLATVPTSSESVLRPDSERKILCARAELALARDDATGALDIADALLVSVPNVSANRVPPRPAQLRAEALTRLARFAEAEACLRELERMALDFGAHSALWRLHVQLARLYRDWNRVDDVAAEIAIARPLIDEIAGRITEPRLSENFRERTLALLHPLEECSASMTEVLSRREVEVMQLVAEGMTDAEVAERLSVSPRTVGTHLTSIYTKLGVTSRTAAARVIFERDVIRRSGG